MEGLAVGRIVHYVLSNGDHRAAVVVRLFPGSEMTGTANLYVFLDGANDANDANVPHGAEYAPGILWATSAHYEDPGQDSGPDTPHTWHWPERV